MPADIFPGERMCGGMILAHVKILINVAQQHFSHGIDGISSESWGAWRDGSQKL